MTTVDTLAPLIDVVEVQNGRTLQNRSRAANAWAGRHHKMRAASSDAHGRGGLGLTFTMIETPPTRANLLNQMSTATFAYRRPPLSAYMHPKLNRLRRRFVRRRFG